jgi:serine/threonine protein kinase
MSLPPDRAQHVYELFQQVKDLTTAEREVALSRSRMPADVLAEVRLLVSDAAMQTSCSRSGNDVLDQLKARLDQARFELEAPRSVGPYRIISLLGEGGFGVVYLAERREPMVQRVAIKVIKPGMDSHAVIARFEQERQVLAVMEHPNIAKVLDAGTTTDGRPYFVMEYVKGEPINIYCDRNRLRTESRLTLFITVCEAVQHAHLKGIIHRDIKPNNILVTEVEGKPIPKVIDFGVAKAVESVLTEKTILTEQGILLGTPEYMSP